MNKIGVLVIGCFLVLILSTSVSAGLFDWIIGKVTEEVATCTDSDGGVYPLIKGSCIDSRGGTVHADKCIKGDGFTQVAEGEYVLEAFCLTPEMREYCKKYSSAEYCDNLPNDCYMWPLIPGRVVDPYFTVDSSLVCPNGCRDGACIKKPDFAISTLSVSNPNPAINELIQIKFTVINLGGDYDSSTSPYGGFSYGITREGVSATGTMASGWIGSLKSEESKTIVHDLKVLDSKTILRVSVDDGNLVNEEIENNNVKSITVLVPVQQPTTTTCTDTDGGKNYDLFGTVSGYSSVTDSAGKQSNQIVTFSDCCTSSTDTTGKCVDQGDTLVERYCQDNYWNSFVYSTCNCQNGACIQSQEIAKILPPFIIAVHENAPSSDVKISTDIGAELQFKGYTTASQIGIAKLYSEISASQLSNQITLAICMGGCNIVTSRALTNEQTTFIQDLNSVLKSKGMYCGSVFADDVSSIYDLCKPLKQLEQVQTCPTGNGVWLTQNNQIELLISGVKYVVEVLDITEAVDACHIKVDDVSAIIYIGDNKTISNTQIKLLDARSVDVPLHDKDICQLCALKGTWGQPITPPTQKELPSFLIAIGETAPSSDVILAADIGRNIAAMGYTGFPSEGISKLYGEIDAAQLSDKIVLVLCKGSGTIILGTSYPTGYFDLELQMALKAQGVGYNTIMSNEVSSLNGLCPEITTQPVTETACQSATELLASIDRCTQAGMTYSKALDDNGCTIINCVVKTEEVPKETVKVCDGCLKDETCLPIGTRIDGQFCSIDKRLIKTKVENTLCQNNFECESNLCIDNSCVSGGLFKKIMEWFRNLFG